VAFGAICTSLLWVVCPLLIQLVLSSFVLLEAAGGHFTAIFAIVIVLLFAFKSVCLSTKTNG
jgi:hypothetical protein